MEQSELLRLLEINAYGVYLNTLVGSPAPRVAALFERLTNPQIGDMVLEITTIGYVPPYGNRLGRLVRQEDEPVYSPEGEGVTEEDLLITEKITYIQTMDGREFRWRNADFIVVAESIDTFR